MTKLERFEKVLNSHRDFYYSNQEIINLAKEIWGEEEKYCKCWVNFSPGTAVSVEDFDPPTCAKCHKPLKQPDLPKLPAKFVREDGFKYTDDAIKGVINKIIDYLQAREK